MTITRRFGILVASGLLAGCAAAPAAMPDIATPRPVLPPPPAFAGCPVKVAAPRGGDDVRVVAARERAGRRAANRCFTDYDGFYRDVAQRFGAP